MTAEQKLTPLEALSRLEYLDNAVNAQDFALIRTALTEADALRARSAKDDEEMHDAGKSDGYESAVRDIDLRTGGDGEYRYCIGGPSDRHCPDAPAMIEKIVQRVDALRDRAAIEDEMVTALFAWMVERDIAPDPCEEWHVDDVIASLALHERELCDAADKHKCEARAQRDYAALEQSRDHYKGKMEEYRVRVAELEGTISGIDDDYMTSEKHHPGYVLIPTEKFEKIRSITSQEGK